jgi:hypothetical protein
MQNFTAFCRERGSAGGTWIRQIQAADADDAWHVARRLCREQCYLEDESQVEVLGIAEGEINITKWHD